MYKDRVGQILLIEKTKSAPNKQRIQTEGLLQNLKNDIMAQKTQRLADAKKKNKKKEDVEISVLSDDEDEENDENDDKMDNLIFLNPNRLTLTYSSFNKRVGEDFDEQLNTKIVSFEYKTILALFIIYAIQTGLLIAVEINYSSEFGHRVDLAVIRIIFAILLLALVVLLPFTNVLKNLKTKTTTIFIIFSYGSIVSIISAIYSNNLVFERIQLIELMLIHAVGVHGG